VPESGPIMVGGIRVPGISCNHYAYLSIDVSGQMAGADNILRDSIRHWTPHVVGRSKSVSIRASGHSLTALLLRGFALRPESAHIRLRLCQIG
jgi:hypothetical protein